MEKRAGEKMDPQDLRDLEDMVDTKESIENKFGTGKRDKKKTADDFAEEPDVDPGIDYMRWSE